MPFPLALPPPVEAAGGGDLGGHALVEEAHERGVVHQQVAADPLLEGDDVGHLRLVLGHERVVLVPVTVDEGVAQEHGAGVGGVDPVVADRGAR